MDEPTAYYTEWSKSEENRYHILMHIFGIESSGTDEHICRAAVNTSVGGSPGGSDGKEAAHSVGDLGSIPG